MAFSKTDIFFQAVGLYVSQECSTFNYMEKINEYFMLNEIQGY